MPCRYWVAHLRDADVDMHNDLVPLIKMFLQTHTLHWLEVLSLITWLDQLVKDLIHVADYMEVCLLNYVH